MVAMLERSTEANRAPIVMLNRYTTSPYAEALRQANPKTDLGRAIREAVRHLPADLAYELMQLLKRSVVAESELTGVLWPEVRQGRCEPRFLGVLSRKLVTDVGVGFIVDAFQNLVELENMKYHGYGTGGAAEDAANTGLTTELTTEYVVNSTRPTGTTTEQSAAVYETVATLSPDSGGTLAITEHGVFSASSAGVLLDRSLFSAVNLVAGSDSLQTTYRLTLAAGG